MRGEDHRTTGNFCVASKMTHGIITEQGSCSRNSTITAAVTECKLVWRATAQSRAVRLCAALKFSEKIKLLEVEGAHGQ